MLKNNNQQTFFIYIKGNTFKINLRSKSTRSNLRTAYQSRVRFRDKSDSEKQKKTNKNNSKSYKVN